MLADDKNGEGISVKDSFKEHKSGIPPKKSAYHNMPDGSNLADDPQMNEPCSFSDLDNSSSDKASGNIEFILDVPLEITVELGRTKMLINDLLKLGRGSVVELSKLAGESLEILANKKLIARGEVVIVNEKYGIRLTEIVSPTERIENLK